MRFAHLLALLGVLGLAAHGPASAEGAGEGGKKEAAEEKKEEKQKEGGDQKAPEIPLEKVTIKGHLGPAKSGSGALASITGKRDEKGAEAKKKAPETFQLYGDAALAEQIKELKSKKEVEVTGGLAPDGHSLKVESIAEVGNKKGQEKGKGKEKEKEHEKK